MRHPIRVKTEGTHGSKSGLSLLQNVKRFREAAQEGDLEAQYILAGMYYRGRGLRPDSAAALNWYHRAAEKGHIRAQFTLGRLYLTQEKYTQAAEWLLKAAGQGDAEAQAQLGRMYTSGLGVPQDNEEAVNWARRAAEQGNIEGQYTLGFLLCFKRPSTVPHDNVEAYMWLTLASAAGHDKCRSFLAMLEAGEMTSEQVEEAKRRAEAWAKS